MASPLHQACASGDTQRVSQLLEEKTDPKELKIFINEFAILKNYRSFPNLPLTPLIVACLTNHLALVTLLINKGADVNKKFEGRMSALGHSLFREVYDLGNIHPPDPLEYNTRLKIVELLLKNGADPNQIEKEEEQKGPPFYSAAKRGKDDLVKLFLKYGHSPLTSTRFPPLAGACLAFEENPVIRILIDHEISLAKSSKFLFNRETDPSFAHHIHPHNLSLLLSLGRPLHNAVHRAVPQNIEPLLEAGAKVVEGEGWKLGHSILTPLDMALELEKHSCFQITQESKKKILDLFKKRPAYMYQRNKHGDRPIEHACKRDKIEAIKFLIDNGSPLFSVRDKILAYLAQEKDLARLDLIQRRDMEAPPLRGYM